MCGSVAHADPSSEIPLSLAVLGGEVVLRSTRGTRVLAAGDFQVDMLTTAREPDEMIAAVRFPAASWARCGVSRGGATPWRFRHHRGRGRSRRCKGRAARRRRHDGASGGAPDRYSATLRLSADAVAALAQELEGYEDLHASARMRRDLLCRIGPVVIEEARTMRRVDRDQRAENRLTLNGRKPCRPRPSRACC